MHRQVTARGHQLEITQTCINPNFAHSVVLLGTLVSLVIAIIGNSIARAFGVFGALAIIRYWVPIRDPKDIVFVLASVVIGLACGVEEYPEAGLATLFFVILAELLHRFPLGLTPPPSPVGEEVHEAEYLKDKKHHKKHKHDDDEDDL